VLVGPELQEVPAACKRWDCPVCGRKNKSKLADRATHYFKGFRVRMWTLTERLGTGRDIMEDFARLRASLAKPRRGKRKRKSRARIRLRYWVVKEFTENGERHLHIEIAGNVPISKTELSRLWFFATERTSYIVDTGRDSLIKKPGAYMLKYMSKGFTQGDFKKHERRWSASRGFPPQVKYHVPGWSFHSRAPDEMNDEMIGRVESKIAAWIFHNERFMGEAEQVIHDQETCRRLMLDTQLYLPGTCAEPDFRI